MAGAPRYLHAWHCPTSRLTEPFGMHTKFTHCLPVGHVQLFGQASPSPAAHSGSCTEIGNTSSMLPVQLCCRREVHSPN